MRAFLLLSVLAACEPSLQRRPLPELVRQAPLTAITVPQLMLVPGEQFSWNVNAKGFTIGRADLEVAGPADGSPSKMNEVKSRFETSRLASAFARMRHELTTVVDRTGARAATELVQFDGQTSRTTLELRGPRYLAGDKVGTIPDGNVGHTLHSALGVIRAWASPDAHAGFLYVVHDGGVYRIDLAQPIVEDMRGTRTLRIPARIRGEVSVSLTIWLTDSDDRTPLRLEIGADGVQLTAELLVTEA